MTEFIFPSTFPTLETERLTLREITQDDADGIFKNFSDPEVSKWFFEQPLTQMEQALEFIGAFRSEFEQGEGLTWAVVLKGDGLFVGTCGYGSVEVGGRGDMGFDLAIGLLKKVGFRLEKVTEEEHYFVVERESWTG